MNFFSVLKVVSGKIKRDKETLYTISGHWDDKVYISTFFLKKY